MEKINMLLLLIMFFPSFVFAGEIYGRISEGREYVGQGINVEIIKYISATDSTIYTGETNEYGSYSIYVKEKGECRLIVHYPNQDPAPEIEVYSYETSVRYNLVLEKMDGKYILRRK